MYTSSMHTSVRVFQFQGVELADAESPGAGKVAARFGAGFPYIGIGEGFR